MNTIGRMIALAVVGLVGVNAVAQPTEHAAFLTGFEAKLRELLQDEDIKAPGATATVAFSDGTVLTVAAGHADIENNIAMTPGTRILSGSIGKTFAAATALSLAKAGELDLDAKIAKWFSDEPWFDRLPNHNDITVRHLLTHSAGLVDHVYTEEFASAIQAQLAAPEPDPNAYLKPLELVECVLDKEPLFLAGEGFSYTDTGYILAGLVIEKVTGQAYYDVLQQRLLEPLELNDTSPSNKRDLEGLASGYLAEDNPFGLPTKIAENGLMFINPAGEWTGGGLVTTSRDLARWAVALYEERAIDSPYLVDLLRSGHTANDAKRVYGLGVTIHELAGATWYGHGGWFPGYESAMFYAPKYGFALAIQANSDHNDPAVRLFEGLAPWVIEHAHD